MLNNLAVPRKPPARVTSITGKPLEDHISQEYYRILQQKQADVHQQYADLIHELFTVGERLKGGAVEEPGRYYFDREKLLVRRTEQGKGRRRAG